MDGINYEDSQLDCYNDFEGAEMYLPVFGENSKAEKDLGFTVEEKSVVGQEVYGEYGFTVKEEEELAKIKGFFARRELAKMKNKGNLDLEIKGRSTVIPATEEDKGLDSICVPETQTHQSGQPSAKQVLAMTSLD